MEEEIWKDIHGYEGLYQVSNLGNIKSLGKGLSNNSKFRILKKSIEGGGYYFIKLYKEGIAKKYKIHRAVALNFIPNLNNSPQVNHIDGNKLNNNVSNLEWCTSQENVLHAYRTGLNKVTDKNSFISNHPFRGIKGKYNFNSRQVIQYDLYLNKIKEWGSLIDIELELGIKHVDISRVCNGKRNRKTAGGFIWKYKDLK